MTEILNQPITLGQLMLFNIIYSFVFYLVEKQLQQGNKNG
jgi:hypothetical protein